MATDQSRARLYNKKILPVDIFRDNLLEYLRGEIKSVLQFNYNNDGILNLAGVPVTATVAQNNQIDVAKAAAPEGTYQATTGLGFLQKFGTADSRLQAINIPPGAGVVYSVGLETAEIDEGVETNPRTGELEYRKITESIGRKGSPTSVAYTGGILSMVVDSITESGVDHSGRQVRVWIKSTQDGGPGAKSSVETTAFETLTVTLSSGFNQIALAATLGQGTSPSTTATDYWVQLIGPTVRRKATEDLTTTQGAVFLADVTSVAAGNPITTIATAAQRIIAFSLADTSDVLRRDSHGFVKILVKADSLDNGEPQIEVRNFSGTTTFKVDETGKITSSTITATGAALSSDNGVVGTGGSASGIGVRGFGGAPNGVGVQGIGTGLGRGGDFTGGASNQTGVRGIGGGTNGAGGEFQGQGTGQGLFATGGGTNGAGVFGIGGATDGVGVTGSGTGLGPGVLGTGGSGGATAGVQGIAGPNGDGVTGTGNGSGYGGRFAGAGGGTGHGLRGDAGAASFGDGVQGFGNATGAGGKFTCGTGRTAISAVGTIDLVEESGTPSAPSADHARLFLRDDGSGNTQLAIIWSNGIVTTIATM